MDEAGEITDLVRKASAGDGLAAEALVGAAYQDLRRIARARLRRSGRDALLDTTSLVSEWFLRFNKVGTFQVRDRSHFLAHAAQIMRNVIVDHARRELADKRGGDAAHVSLTVQLGEAEGLGAEDILAIHEALESVAGVDPRLILVVEMRYFAGLSENETAEALGLSTRTVRRDWTRARLLLLEALGR